MRRFSMRTACSVALAGVFAVACQDSPTGTEETQQVSGDVVTVDRDGFAVGPVPRTSAPPAVRLSVAASSGDVILPAAYATKMGEANNTFPHAFANMRYQQVFLGSEIGGPRRFRELCLRFDDVFGGPAGVQQIALKLGPTNLDHTNLGTSFAGNYSAPPTTVFAGNVNIPASSGGGNVNSFNICIPFSTIFSYTGGNLIVEMINTSAVSLIHFEDFCRGAADCTTTRAWARSASASTATFVDRNQGLVMKLVGAALMVDIDIKPGSDPNCFNNDGHGVIPVAILGAADFDVTQVDPSTVQLEGLSVASKGKSGKLMAHVEDVNGDGFDDLVLQIEDVAGTFTSGSGTATLTGNLFDGTPFEGSDDICVVPSAPPPPIGILFDNGSSSGPQSNIGNTAGVQELFEDFTVDQNWVITEINWEEHDHNQATYLSTEVLVFVGLPFNGPPVFSSTIVANRTPNSTGTILGNWDGFDYRITGVSISLPPGTYWIGLNQNFQGIRSGWDTTTGGPNAIPGFRIVNINFPAPGLVNGGNLAFTLLGQLP